MPDTLSPVEAIARFQTCYIGHEDDVVEVWEPGERFEDGLPPNRIGCERCNYMARVEWGF